eukprot:1018370-Rhodomonas_salina.1
MMLTEEVPRCSSERRSAWREGLYTTRPICRSIVKSLASWATTSWYYQYGDELKTGTRVLIQTLHACRTTPVPGYPGTGRISFRPYSDSSFEV